VYSQLPSCPHVGLGRDGLHPLGNTLRTPSHFSFHPSRSPRGQMRSNERPLRLSPLQGLLSLPLEGEEGDAVSEPLSQSGERGRHGGRRRKALLERDGQECDALAGLFLLL